MSTRANVKPSDRVTVADDVHFRRFDDEIIVLHLGRGDYFSLNEVGAQMWVALADGQSPEEVAQSLVEHYEVGREKLVQDCMNLVEDLLRGGLVRLKER